ncbi:MAG: hypothetical protein NVS4B8_28170 [Herpetosiphon sp.]
MSNLLAVTILLLSFIYIIIITVSARFLTVPRRHGGEQSGGAWSYSHNPRTAAGLEYQDVTFPARGDRVLISGWFVPAPGATRTIIFVHGKDKSRLREFQGGSLRFLRAMHERGFAMLMIDMRGHGASGNGRFTFGLRERRDILGAVDWLRGHGFAAGHIGLLGASMGAAASIYAAADEPAIGALVVDSSYAAIYPVLQDLARRYARPLRFFLRSLIWSSTVWTGVNIGRSRPVDVIGRISPRPVLIIHGTRDWLIPPSDAEQLHHAAPGSELWIVPDAGHVRIYAADPAAYVRRIAGFFDRSLVALPQSARAA